MPTTTSGWPYVAPADHPLEFPASSQSLANMLESNGLKATLNSWTPAAPWTSSNQLLVTKMGPLVVVSGMVKPASANQNLTANTGVTIGTLPAGFAPTQTLTGYAAALTAAGYAVGIAYVSGTTVQFIPLAAMTINTTGYIGIDAVFRA